MTTFVKVRLETDKGEFLGYGEIPEFAPPADIVVWKERFFRRVEVHHRDRFLVYRESLACFISADDLSPRPDAA